MILMRIYFEDILVKEDKFYNPFIQKVEHEVRIERDDIEQALSWFDRLPMSQTTSKDEKVYDGLRKVVAHMRALDIE